ncbi:MAG: bifunctional methylenetetrahydrofolate dehydrogenase/methenyltetrahydrofolate cyclohydrolase FolD [Candidatus Sericytochromatia bacterium]|nr:bifunctional methylenetetrahydrofolate dehydrogenase/methenyltetrahydrofolate cyclohydrolase FolD [Candidatus Sericytochromatia bacterium]
MSSVATVLDGKALAGRIREDLARLVAQRPLGSRPPCLAVVQVGEVAASTVYVRNKHRACEQAGFDSRSIHLPETLSEGEVAAHVAVLSADPGVDGILVQLPLPSHMDPHVVLAGLAPSKDVDGLLPLNIGNLVLGLPGPRACTPAGIMRLLRHHDVPLAGTRAVVLGRSAIVGKPLAALLVEADATVTVAHSRSRDLADLTRHAELLVVAVGRPLLVTAEMVRPGAAVVDVGINRVPDGSVVGDVHPEVAHVAGWLTPVPGGVGPMTIAALLENTWQSYVTRLGSSPP